MVNINGTPEGTHTSVSAWTCNPLRWLRARDQGSMAVLCAVMIPSLIGLGTLTVDQGYYGYRKLLLVQTVQAAALAAGNKIGTYYSTGGSNTAIVATAQTFATLNMPTTQYGTVVTLANVVVGNWNSTTRTFTSLASSRGTSPDAVQVTGLNTATNGNPVPLFLGSFFGRPSADISSTAIVSYGTGQQFNAIIINDMSGSFSSELATQKTADDSILNCVKGATGTTSLFGITFINGHATIYQPLVLASTSNLHGKIQSINSNSCGANCGTGSNVASGIYSAIQQFSNSGQQTGQHSGQNSGSSTSTSKNIVLITDGVPNASEGKIYSPADGVTCTNHCTDADMLAGAQTQAAAANAAGISISTIYYSGSTAVQDQASYAASVGSLRTGKGVSMVAPTSAAISAAYAGFCSTIPSSVKMFM